ncbi:TRAP transporter small permease [Neomoorella mulderi]|uniref:2,3-diketo-L-gulonate TRAP transporter small permease protein YiaM n=1 Tax=Moorella mulderi DSM 14980 TaxID=1122241 RepID=A0A151AZX0_9FIRM|nr:TRAP transporter small permease [Moorella mulderi]KYH33110.1 2,3-diketo-L-gulonate TRAP transporter small permease protein YiaM [Moorella mulderi DSM 14980]
MERKCFFENWVENIIAMGFAAFVIIVFAQVIFRYVLNNSLTWAEEFARYVFIWIVFLAGAIAVKRGSHMELDLFVNFLPRLPRFIVHCFSLVVVMAFSAFITYEGWLLAQKTWNTPSPAMQIPMGLVYLCLPIGGVVIIIYSLFAIKNLIISYKQGGC